MPRKSDHIGMSILVLAAGIVIFGKMGYITPIVYTFAFAIGNILPAIFEPSHPHSKYDFFHSKTMLRRCVYGVGVTLIIGAAMPIMLFIMFLVLGYIAHLLVDAPSGLPE